MKKATHLITVAILSICLNACGITSDGSTERNIEETVASKRAESIRAANDAQTENSNQENKEEKLSEQTVQYGDANCRDDNDCFLCKSCNTNTHKCEFLGKGTKTSACGGNNFQCDGQGGCECANNFTGDECNACQEGFTGSNCDQCLPWHFGPDCKPCTCIANMGNTCNEGINGNGKCSSCWQYGWGENCQNTTDASVCLHGTLDQETGICKQCDDGYSGKHCDIENDCKYGYKSFGINGTGKCSSCYTGGDIETNCEKCLPTYTYKDNPAFEWEYCNECAPGWKRDYQGLCNWRDCNPVGTKKKNQYGECVCYSPYTGEYCDDCRPSDKVPFEWPEARPISGWYWYAGSHGERGECRFIDIRIWKTSIEDFTKTYRGYFNKDTNKLFMFGVTKDENYEYSWADAQTVCPKGWRLPYQEEFTDYILTSYIKQAYRSTDYWLADESSATEATFMNFNQITLAYTFGQASKNELKKVACINDKDDIR